MKILYIRISLYSFRIGLLALLFVPIVAYLTYIDIFLDLEPLFIVGIFAVFLLIGSFYFKNTGNKLPDFSTTISSKEFMVSEFNFQHDISWYSRLYLVSHEGEQLYVIEPTVKKLIPRYLTFFTLVSSGLLIPITYNVMTLDRTRIFSFTVKNEWKQFRVTILNEQDEQIATYVQPWGESALKNKGVIYHPNQSAWRNIEAKNMSGDIDIRDDDNLITASYRFGMFPYTLHPAFHAFSKNIHIKLGSHISNDERKVYLAIFYFWLYESIS